MMKTARPLNTLRHSEEGTWAAIRFPTDVRVFCQAANPTYTTERQFNTIYPYGHVYTIFFVKVVRYFAILYIKVVIKSMNLYLYGFLEGQSVLKDMRTHPQGALIGKTLRL